jgi:general secretion pathway protein K
MIRKHPRRGAAMLLALLILTLVAALSAGMVWQQWRAIQVEAAERARAQAAWILYGALDWARLILREDARNNQSDARDHLGEPWAVPLAEARLSSFLAADKDNNSLAENDSLDAFLSGSITDAQAKWNLRRLIDADGKVVAAELAVLRRLCDAAGATSDCADRLATAAVGAWSPAASASRDEGVIPPQRLAQFAWLEIDADTLARLEPWVILLPDPAIKVNVNTAPAEVIAAVVENLSLGAAQRVVQELARTPLKEPELQAGAPRVFPPGVVLTGLGATSTHFVVQGRLRLGERVLEERSLVQRRQLEIVVLSRERLNLREGS